MSEIMIKKQSLSQKRKMFNIPFEILRYIVHKGIFSEAAVYFALKYRCDGLIEVNPDLIKGLSQELAVSPKTIRRKIKWLESESWITVLYSAVYRIKSFDKLYYQTRLGKSTVGILWDPPIFTETKTFCITSCAGYLIRCQSLARRRVPLRKHFSGTQTSVPLWQLRIKDLIESGAFDPHKGYISKSYFSLKMRIPESTAYDYLTYACGTIHLKRTGHMAKMKTPSEEDYPGLLDDSILRKMKFDKGELFLILPNSYIADSIARQRGTLYQPRLKKLRQQPKLYRKR